MAVKPINKQVVHDALTNRAEHISTKNLKDIRENINRNNPDGPPPPRTRS